MFRDPTFNETFRVLPVHLRVIGAEEDPEHPTRSRLVFAGEVRDGQTMVGRVEMTPDGHLRWKWVRSCFMFSAVLFALGCPPIFQVCGESGQALWR
jgi:hypothetical protein